MVVPRVSSALKAVDLRQEPAPLIIGERLNTQGSRKAKRLVMEGDLDGLVEIAREQAEGGAHCIDVCVAATELADEKGLMVRLVKRLSMEIEAPLVVDSTDPDVIEAAIRQIPGRPIINSINLEGDGARFASLAPVMARYGVPAVAMCIGPGGMAKTPAEKLGTARLLYEEGKKYRLVPEQFIFDVLTFTLGTGNDEYIDAGVHTLGGIRAVKEAFPTAYTTLGLSNISFGLMPPARRILNSVFLYHAVKSGLDSAIVNAREIVPYAQIGEKERRLAEDLIFNAHPAALPDLIAHFEGEGAGGTGAAQAAVAKVDPSWPAGRRANFRIINRLKDGVEGDVAAAVAERMGGGGAGGKAPAPGEAPSREMHEAAIATLNGDLLPAMKEVGDMFGAGELILPFVLKSAECMKAAVAELERYLIKEEGSTKGKLVLGTVYGDVHDIGKNLVKTIFENNGYTVHDLGKQVPLQRFLDAIEETGADAVGLSALLVSTSKQMQLFVEHARRHGMTVPVLCGGAAINTNYINRVARGDGQVYKPGVFYCNTMFDGLRAMDMLVSDKRQEFVAQWRTRLDGWKDASAGAPASGSGAGIPRSDVVPVGSPPVRPQLNAPVRLDASQIDARRVWEVIDKKSLFKLSWGLRGKAGRLQEDEHERLFAEWKQRIDDESMFEPAAVYGYFACRAQGTKLVVDSPGGGSLEFDFPRSLKPRHLCIADYFGSDGDVVAFQAVTAGERVADVIDRLNKEDRYSDAYYLHGLAVEFAEGMAAWVNQRIKADFGIAGGGNNGGVAKGGLRYSWGYPSCPDVEQHKMVWRLLAPEKSGMTLTSSGQIVPEQSTAAMVVHHPEAEYFVI